ncbi:MAG TPA: 4'-phosphopantetheinyl transferase superfamily protein [Candidatus Limnocylindrales bacterium]
MRWLIRQEEALPASLDWLTPYEQDWAHRLRLAKRRNDYLLRRYVAKEAMAKATGMQGDGVLARIEVRNAPSGAPFALIDGEPARLHLSVTDRCGWAVCLVGKAGAGCDLEAVEPRSEGFVQGFLTEAEQAYVDASADKHEAVNLVWSAKESGLKLVRLGLSLDTRDVEVTVQSGVPSRDGWGALSVEVPGGRGYPGWWRRGGDFVLTVVSQAEAPPPRPLEGQTGPFRTEGGRVTLHA